MVSFDAQAADFDLRAGFPARIARQIAGAVAELAPSHGGVVLDLGAGTGQIGIHLVPLLASRGRCHYLGMDLSRPMLAVFHQKLGADASRGTQALVQADASVRWPIASGAIHLVFSSRAAHLFPPAVLVEEALRVAHPGGAIVVFGGVRSAPDSLRAILRREMRRLLAEQGVEGRRAGAAQHRLTRALEERGGEPLSERTAATWTVVQRARDALAAWRAKAGLAGRTVALEVQERVLRQLEDWVREHYGSLDIERETTERYELVPIRIGARA